MAAAIPHTPARRRLFGSKLALAIALASGTVLTATALEAPAYAQKRKKDKAPKADYSEAFIAAYKPLEEQLNAENADINALKAGIPGLVAAATTADDKSASGNLILNIGNKASDPALQRQGLELMLSSGKVGEAELPRLTAIAGQLAYNLNDYAAARQRMEQAIALGYNENGPEAMVAETYFQEENYPAGLQYLTSAIDKRIAAGQPVDVAWIRRGLAVAYTNNLPAQARDYSLMYVERAPTTEAWNDAILVALQTSNFEAQEVLDLLRLSRATNTLKRQTYMEYIESANPVRLPGEVIAVINEGVAAGELDRSDSFITESLATANRQVAADRAELPSIERDAMASGAQLRTVMAAGDAFLNYGEFAKAEALYQKALGMPGANTGTALTRLGIAQLRQGKLAEAQDSFGKVQGSRQAIARLWGVYAKQEAGSAAPTAAAPIAEAASDET